MILKKKILFLIGNLESGGVSKSMVSLLNTIDRKKYDVSLWIGNPSGLFYELLPNDIRLLSDKRITLLLKGVNGLSQLLRHGYLLLFFGSLLRLVVSTFNKAYAGWLLAKLMPNICKGEEFDLIVDYNGQQQLYYMVDKLKGKKKISFFHSDYSKWPFYYEMDKRYYPKIDYIYTISDVCVQSLKKYFPYQKDKIGIMENISSPQLIEKMAKEQIPDKDINKSKIKILTIGHISHNKGSDLAIRAAAILKNRDFEFKWFFLGKEIDNFKGLIKELDVTEQIVYLGMQANPYPYLKQADLYVHPSLFEGKSIALDEAKILCKPIVVTNFSTVKDQFEDRINASICEMSPESIANAIEELLAKPELALQYRTYLKSHMTDNTSEVEKLYRLIDC